MKSKLPHVGTTIFTVMSAMAHECGAVNLSQGFPDFEPDRFLLPAIEKAMKENQIQYAPMPGRLDLRTTIAELTGERYKTCIQPDSEITITAGATQAIFTALGALVEPGDEVILFDPAYDCYDPGIRVFGGVPVHLNLVYPTFQIDWHEVEQKITSKTKVIVVNNPHNPTGNVWSLSDLNSLEKLLLKHPQLVVISDEVYEYIRFDQKHISVLQNEIIRQRSFVMFSFGKTLHVTGWKIGYCIAPPMLTTEFRKVHQFNVFCVNNTMQYAIQHYLSHHAQLENIAHMYEEKKNFFLNGLQNTKLKPLACNGTYFLLCDYSSIAEMGDVLFAEKLTREFGVASIPVSVFYEDQTDHHLLRFCFAKKEETLTHALDKLCKI